MDILCQTKSGAGKAVLFVLAKLQQLKPTKNLPYVLVMCHTCQWACQIGKAYERLAKYMSNVKKQHATYHCWHTRTHIGSVTQQETESGDSKTRRA